MLNVGSIRAAVSAGRVEWRAHALRRMLERNINRAAVVEVITEGEQIRHYADDRPFPSSLFLGSVHDRVVHVIAALDADDQRVYVISAYEPDPEVFEPDHRTRKRPR